MDIAQRLKGQEHIKRALEVAAVNGHSVNIITQGTYLDAVMYVEPLAKALGVTQISSLKPCACGNYGSPELTCVCPENFIYFVQPYADITVTLPLPNYEKLSSDRLGEPLTVIYERVVKAREFLPKVNPQLDGASQSLMKAACRQLAMTQYVYDKVVEIAVSVAALAGSKTMSPAYLAEAVQYRPRQCLL